MKSPMDDATRPCPATYALGTSDSAASYLVARVHRVVSFRKGDGVPNIQSSPPLPEEFKTELRVLAVDLAKAILDPGEF